MSQADYDPLAEERIRARIAVGINPLAAGEAQYLLDQLDRARAAVAEAGRLSRDIEARVADIEAKRDHLLGLEARTRALLKRAQDAQAESRAGAAEDRNVVSGLHARIRKIESEVQEELVALRRVAAAAMHYRMAEEGGLADEAEIQVLGARQVLDDALLELARLVEEGEDGSDG